MEKTLQSVITFYLILPHFPLLGILQQTPHPKNSSVVCVTWVDRNRGRLHLQTHVVLWRRWMVADSTLGGYEGLGAVRAI